MSACRFEHRIIPGVPWRKSPSANRYLATLLCAFPRAGHRGPQCMYVWSWVGTPETQ